MSHITYGILVWGNHAARIAQLQKKVIRIITNSRYNAHTSPLFKSLNCLKFEDLYKLNVLKFYFKTAIMSCLDTFALLIYPPDL